MKIQRKTMQALFVALAVVSLTGLFPGAARADNDGWHHHDRYAHARYRHEDHDRDAYWHHARRVEYRHYYYDEDGRLEVYYSSVPRMVVRQAAVPSGFNIVIPFDIR